IPSETEGAMSHYKSNVRDLEFNLFEVLGVQQRLGSGVLAESDERSEEHTSELQSRFDLVCRLLLEKKKVITGIGLVTSLRVALRLSWTVKTCSVQEDALGRWSSPCSITLAPDTSSSSLLTTDVCGV